MSLFFKAESRTIGDIFFEKKVSFKVPLYQRPYDWGQDQLSDFYEDILNGDNFIGSIILSLVTDDDSEYREVIDGQQRLTTIQILFCVMRDVAKNLGQEAHATSIIEQTLYFKDRWNNKQRRFHSGFLTDKFMDEYLFKADKNITEVILKEKYLKNIQNSYMFFLETFEKKLEGLNAIKKINFLKKIQNNIWNLQCIEILAEDAIDAYEIFEKINATGKELNTADLIKNLIFKNLQGDDSRLLAQEYWTEIYDLVSPTKIDIKSFIRYHWLSKYSFETDKNLYKAVKNKIESYDKFISELDDASKYFVDIIENGIFENFDNRSDFIESHTALKAMGVRQQYVLILCLYRKSIENDAIKPYFSEVYKLLEEFSFLYFTISNLPARDVETLYSKYAVKISELDNDDDGFLEDLQLQIDNLRNDLSELIPNKKSLIGMLGDNLIYKQSSKQIMLIRYIFRRLETNISSGENKIDLDNIHIEHCLPRNPHNEWNLSKDSDDFRNHVNKIGNLTLLSKQINNRIKNRLISKKLNDYKKSQLNINDKYLTKIIEKNNLEWDYSIIRSRTKILSKKIIKTFHSIKFDD